MWPIILGIWLALWLSAVVGVQIALALSPRFVNPLTRLDPFRLIPDWRLFSGPPASGDVFIVYRERGLDGTVRNWDEIPVGRRGIPRLWDPSRRQRKAALVLATGILAQAARHRGEHDRIFDGEPFECVRRFVCSLPAGDSITARQVGLAVVGATGHTSPTLVLVSPFFPLATTSDRR